MKELKISLAAARVNAGLTQAEVADKMGVTANTVVNWEKGNATPSVIVARQLANLYGLELNNIFFPKEANLICGAEE